MDENNYPSTKVSQGKIRPNFPKRAVITAGMPYGNKDLHFGHIGGVFVSADIFARFMRDRIGKENVIFVSGTDCYGSPIVEDHRKALASDDHIGDIERFVRTNHDCQDETLRLFYIDVNLFAASSFGRSGIVHKEVCGDFFIKLISNGHLVKLNTLQFFDTKMETFLNGRQVVGQCPVLGCSSEKGYADECSLGHQYDPRDLINPRSTLSGEIPEMREVTNWYFKLPGFNDKLKKWLRSLIQIPGHRLFMVKSIEEFLEPPTIHITKNQIDVLEVIVKELPGYTRMDNGKSKSICLLFGSLEEREDACVVLRRYSIRYRTGKTLVPFRLTGNIPWGLPVPDLDGMRNLTFWVWPESLWAPISFTATFLEQQGKNKVDWRDWWCSKDSKVYQFIGEDNIYFYGVAEMAMFMADQGKKPSPDPEDGQLQLPELIVNKHLLFLDKKASSSGEVKPPMARDLLAFYTVEQLRAHFFSLGLGIRNVSFRPKPLNPTADEKDSDPVLKEGNLLSNVFNHAIRTCFYTTQKYYNGTIPIGKASQEILTESNDVIVAFEMAMFQHEFHIAFSIVDRYIRGINKYWVKNIEYEKQSDDNNIRRQTLIDAFHMVRVACVLLHPVAPKGTDMVREYLNIGEEFWSWDRIFEPIYTFMKNPSEHYLKHLEPRVDFFEKHPRQVCSCFKD